MLPAVGQKKRVQRDPPRRKPFLDEEPYGLDKVKSGSSNSRRAKDPGTKKGKGRILMSRGPKPGVGKDITR